MYNSYIQYTSPKQQWMYSGGFRRKLKHLYMTLLTYLEWVSVHRRWGSPPESGRAGCRTLSSSVALAQTYTAPPGTIWAVASQTRCVWVGMWNSWSASVSAGDAWVHTFESACDTYRLSDSASLLWLNLQNDFHKVSTRVNWRLTITSRIACEDHI